MIDEELVGFTRSMQRIQQRRTEMADNRVIMANAGLIGKFTNARRAAPFGDVVARRAR